MKNLYIAFSFVIASSTITAQNAATKKADKLYSRSNTLQRQKNI